MCPIRVTKAGRKPRQLKITTAEMLSGTKSRENKDSKFTFRSRIPSAADKKVIQAACLAEGVRAIFSLHTYQFNVQIYLQQHGSPTGVDIAVDCAKMAVYEWSREVLKMLESNNVTCKLAASYIDDIRKLLKALRLGVYWVGAEKYLKYSKKLEIEERSAGISLTEKT